MKDLLYKAAAVGASASLFLASAGAVAADSAGIRGNGARSRNRINITYDNGGTTSQVNAGNITTLSNSTADSGDNRANSNTNGGVSVTTGDAAATTDVSNEGHLNTAGDTCGCDGDSVFDAAIEGNGDESDSAINFTKLNRRDRTQRNTGDLFTDARNVGRTGRNRANANTGPGDVTVGTGGATASTDVENIGHANE